MILSNVFQRWETSWGFTHMVRPFPWCCEGFAAAAFESGPPERSPHCLETRKCVIHFQYHNDVRIQWYHEDGGGGGGGGDGDGDGDGGDDDDADDDDDDAVVIAIGVLMLVGLWACRELLLLLQKVNSCSRLFNVPCKQTKQILGRIQIISNVTLRSWCPLNCLSICNAKKSSRNVYTKLRKKYILYNEYNVNKKSVYHPYHQQTKIHLCIAGETI